MYKIKIFFFLNEVIQLNFSMDVKKIRNVLLKTNIRKKKSKNKKFSGTGNRTRASWVKARYPSH